MIKPKKLKVAIILISNTIGGAEKRFTNLFNHLITHGEHEYSLLINTNLYNLLKKAGFQFSNKGSVVLLGEGIKRLGLKEIRELPFLKRYVYLFKLKVYNKLVDWRAKRTIRKYNPDIIHGILNGTRILDFYPNGSMKRVASFVSPGNVPTFQRDALEHAHAIDILSEGMKRVLVDNKVSSDDHMYVAPGSFTDYSRTYVAKKERLVVFLARMTPFKHPEIFVDMVKQIPKEIAKSTKFVMIGDGELMGRMKKLGESLVEENILEFKGYVSNPIPHLAKSAIFVQTTDCESHGTQSLLEAMACGNAIVTTDLVGIEKIVDDSVGFRVPLTSKAFAEKVSYLLQNTEIADKMGSNAKQKALKTQTIENYQKHIDYVYNNAYGNIKGKN